MDGGASVTYFPLIRIIIRPSQQFYATKAFLHSHQIKQVEFVRTPICFADPHLLLIYLEIGKAIQKTISKNKTAKKIIDRIVSKWNHKTFPSGVQKLF